MGHRYSAWPQDITAWTHSSSVSASQGINEPILAAGHMGCCSRDMTLELIVVVLSQFELFC